MATGYTPFDVKATGYNPAQSDLNGYNSVNQNFQGYQGAQAGSTGYGATKQNYQGYSADTVNPYGKASVTDNLTSLLDENSPLMQRASQKGLIAANQRGLLNSSMAAGAAQASLYDVAVPLATSDAQLFSQNQQFNSGVINRAREFGASAANSAFANDAASANRASEFGAAAQNTATLSNQNSTNQANQFSAASANAAFANDAQSANAARQFTAEAGNREALANQQSRDSASQFAASAANRAAELTSNNFNTAAQFNAEQGNREQLLQLENQNKIGLANIEANFKNVIQTSASAQEVVKSYQAGVAQIQQNKDLDAPAKLRATQNLYESTKAALTVLGQVSNLNLAGAFPALITN